MTIDFSDVRRKPRTEKRGDFAECKVVLNAKTYTHSLDTDIAALLLWAYIESRLSTPADYHIEDT